MSNKITEEQVAKVERWATRLSSGRCDCRSDIAARGGWIWQRLSGV
jgi:hypothetical protein